MYGDTTAKFIAYLKKHGPQTVKQLEGQLFWGGVRSRVNVLINQGRVIKIEVANPLTGRAVVKAYKAADSAEEGPMKRERRAVGETYAERVRRERKERAVTMAIALLEKQGYEIMPPNAEIKHAAE